MGLDCFFGLARLVMRDLSNLLQVAVWPFFSSTPKGSQMQSRPSFISLCFMVVTQVLFLAQFRLKRSIGFEVDACVQFLPSSQLCARPYSLSQKKLNHHEI